MGAEVIFNEISLILVVALIVAIVSKLLKQPLVISYIIAGIIISPVFLNIIHSTESFSAFAQIGIALLLFMVGMGLNPKAIKEVGKVAFITGIGQILFTTFFGFLLGKIIGLTNIQSIYVALAVSFSSTIIIMKLLTDKGDTNTLYGKISIGFLLVQDIIAIIILMAISATIGHTGASLESIALNKAITGGILLLALGLISWLILPIATKKIAHSQELLLLFSITWALAISALFAKTGFSIEIGALLAGISLSLSPYRFEISSKMKPLRDFFVLIFFLLLGSQMSFGNITEYVPHIILYSSLILIGNPFIVILLMGILGYKKRTGFLAGLTVSQISEFSFILIALGVKVGHLPNELLSMMTLIGLITMGGSTYAVMYGEKLYRIFAPLLTYLEFRKGDKEEMDFYTDKDYDVILLGYNRIGYSLVKEFTKMKKSFLVVDYNPETIKQLALKQINARYGDVSDLELIRDLPIEKCKMIISTVPENETSEMLIEEIRSRNKEAIIILVAHQIEESLLLYKLGADYIITPHFLGGTHTAEIIDRCAFNREKFKQEKAKEISELKQRRKEGQEHPAHERD